MKTCTAFSGSLPAQNNPIISAIADMAKRAKESDLLEGFPTEGAEGGGRGLIGVRAGQIQTMNDSHVGTRPAAILRSKSETDKNTERQQSGWLILTVWKQINYSN